MGYATCNRVNMEALIVALEAGKYPQAQQYLKVVGYDGTVVGYCCAGVAGVLAEEAGVGSYDQYGVFTDAEAAIARYEQDNEGYYVIHNQVMTRGITRWLGLDGEPMHAQNLPAGEGSEEWGTSMNDEGQSFAYIAAALRSWYGIPKAAHDA